MKVISTLKMLHNFHFTESKFFSKKWKKKEIYLRQIAFDSYGLPDTFFALDKNNFDLFIYFEPFGTKLSPRLIMIGKMPKNYQTAIEYISQTEIAMLAVIDELPYEELKRIKKGEEMKEVISSFSKIMQSYDREITTP